MLVYGVLSCYETLQSIGIIHGGSVRHQRGAVTSLPLRPLLAIVTWNGTRNGTYKPEPSKLDWDHVSRILCRSHSKPAGPYRLRFTTQQPIPIVYKGLALGASYRADLVVEETVVVEAKSVERLLAVHEAQVLTYLRLNNNPVGLLINFNVAKLTDGVRRLLNAKYVDAGCAYGPRFVGPLAE